MALDNIFWSPEFGRRVKHGSGACLEEKDTKELRKSQGGNFMDPRNLVDTSWPPRPGSIPE